SMTIALVGELRDVAAEDVRQPEQHRRRHRTLVVLDLADVAEREPQAAGECTLCPAAALPQAPHAGPHEKLPDGGHFTSSANRSPVCERIRSFSFPLPWLAAACKGSV